MSHASPSNTLDSQVGQIAGEFLDRLQAGEQPDVEDYARRHPEIADVLRQALPALLALAPQSLASSPSSPEEEGLPGRLGDFQVHAKIGQGGMGIVYEAEQVSLGRRVALKVLPFAATMDPRQLQRFQNEARAAGQLHHTNIVPVYAVGCERGVHFYAMQYIEGQSLAGVIAGLRRSPAPAPSVRQPAANGAPLDDLTNGRPSLSDTRDARSTAPIAGLSTSESTKHPAYFRTV